MDYLQLKGITSKGCHGLFEFEKTNPQPFIVDLILGLNLNPAAESDDLNLGVHYGEVEEAVVSAVRNQSFNLIEKLALFIITSLFHQFPELDEIEIQLSKPEAPLSHGSIPTVILRRSRESVK